MIIRSAARSRTGKKPAGAGKGRRIPGRTGKLIRIICLLCLAALLPLGTAPAEEKPAPTVRVLLRRLNLTDRMDLQTAGVYTVRWGKDGRMLMPDRSRITVQVREGKLFLFFSGAALECGASLRFERTGEGGAMAGLTVLPGEALYPGDLSLTVAGGQLQPVLSLSVEDYLLGVVPFEMSDDFPLEALKAQAVCARTYALSRLNPKKAYDLEDTTNDQVFRGVTGSHDRSDRAVRETAGVVGTSGGGLAECYYSASNGGQTELPAHVWGGRDSSACYAVTEDPYDLENPESVIRKARIRKDGKNLPETLERSIREAFFALPGMEDWVRQEDAFRIDEVTAVALTTPRFEAPCRLMTKLEITVRVSGKRLLPAETPDPLTYEPDDGEEDDAPTPAPAPAREARLSDFTEAGTFTVSVDLFPYLIREMNMSIYGADNEIVTVTENGDHWLLAAGRFGHGVGMSQRGAQWMAGKYGKNFQEILEFYFPGMELKKTSSGPALIPTPDPLLARTPGPAASPTPRPTLMPVTEADLPEGAWIASVEGIDDDSSLNLRAEPAASSEILMRLYKHQRLIVLETCEDPAWVHVRTDSAEGYVMVSFLEKAP